MSLRHKVQSNPVIGYAIVGIALGLSVLIYAMGGEKGDKIVDKVWFYDLNLKEKFVVDATVVAPIETDSGPHDGEPAGVRAMVVGCGDCSDPFIGYLLKMSDEWKATENRENLESASHQSVRTLEGEWFSSAELEQMNEVTSAMSAQCAGKRLTRCYPNR